MNRNSILCGFVILLLPILITGNLNEEASIIPELLLPINIFAFDKR